MRYPYFRRLIDLLVGLVSDLVYLSSRLVMILVNHRLREDVCVCGRSMFPIGCFFLLHLRSLLYLHFRSFSMFLLDSCLYFRAISFSQSLLRVPAFFLRLAFRCITYLIVCDEASLARLDSICILDKHYISFHKVYMYMCM
jgi:hypothetical protein